MFYGIKTSIKEGNEMAKINKEEYEILKKDLKEGYKWIARDKSGSLYTHEDKVVKATESWLSRRFKPLDSSNLFQFIQWEDGVPHSIAELIEECEGNLIKFTPWTPNPLDFNESEETEVKKDKKWLVDKWTKERNETDVYDPMYQFTSEFIADVNQLDEPEEGTMDDEDETFVSSYDLQNLLVPKQEVLTDEQIAKKVGQAYKDGYEKGKEHATEKEKETVASVLKDFLVASAKLRMALGMEVEELEE